MKIRILFIISVLIITAVLPSYAQNMSTTSGLNWLSVNQNADGSWGANASTLVVDTTVVINAMMNLGNSSKSLTAVRWLTTQDVTTVDELSRKTMALANVGSETNTSINALIDATNSEGGWGYRTDYTSTPLDTALALQALKSSNYPDLSIINNALAYLTNTQNADGGWGFSSGDDSSIYLTAIVSATLQQFPQTAGIATAITKASAYLTTLQNIDGGFGVTPSGAQASTVYETALAYIALIGDGQTQGLPLQKAVNYLTSAQSMNGSWNDDPYSTALALKAQ